MKVVILAGGYGSRLSEETHAIPKPMVTVGNKPILWHIMKIYSHYGFNDFVILLGYKGYVLKEYFANYFLHQSDVQFDLANNRMELLDGRCEPWRVTLLETGLNTQTGGRVLRAKPYLNETFMLTYGDGVSNVDLPSLLDYHQTHKAAVTLSAIQPAGRFGAIVPDETGRITCFTEKPQGDGGWINGGFMVCEPKLFDYLTDDQTILEREPLENLARDQQLVAYKHYGFWKCMDTQRDQYALDKLWSQDEAPWRLWDTI